MYIHSRGSVAPGPRGDGPVIEQQQVFNVTHVATHTPIGLISRTGESQHYTVFLAWIVKTLSVLLFTTASPSLPNSSPSLSKRSLDPNTTTSIVAGILVSAFVICVGIFYYFYGKSIRIHRKRHRHRSRRRASGNSKVSHTSDAVVATAAGGGGGGEEGGEPAPQT